MTEFCGMEFTEENVKNLLKKYIKKYEDGYEDYMPYIAGAVEDIYAELFGVFPWQENVTHRNDEW